MLEPNVYQRVEISGTPPLKPRTVRNDWAAVWNMASPAVVFAEPMHVIPHGGVVDRISREGMQRVPEHARGVARRRSAEGLG